MLAVKQKILNLVETMPDFQLAEVENFIMFVKARDESKLFEGLEFLSTSSVDFWDNEIDDEVWNDV